MIRKTIVVLVILLALAPLVAADDVNDEERIFTLDITLYEAGGGELEDVDIQEGTVTNFANFEVAEPTHELLITDRDTGDTLFQQDLHVSFALHPTPVNESVDTELGTVEEQEYFWRLPYDWSAKNLTLYEFERGDTDGHDHDVEIDHDTRDVVFTVDLEDEFCSGEPDGECRSFCDGKQVDVDCSCGDGVCHPHESEETCPEDCVDDTGIGDDPTDVDEPDEDPLVSPLIGAVAALLIVSLTGLGLYAWRKRSRQAQGQQDYGQQEEYNQGYQQQNRNQGRGYQQSGNQYDQDDRYR